MSRIDRLNSIGANANDKDQLGATLRRARDSVVANRPIDSSFDKKTRLRICDIAQLQIGNRQKEKRRFFVAESARRIEPIAADSANQRLLCHANDAAAIMLARSCCAGSAN